MTTSTDTIIRLKDVAEVKKRICINCGKESILISTRILGGSNLFEL